MTFQELVDEMSLDTIFLNTSVDVATQNALLEWFFDYDLADDDTSKCPKASETMHFCFDVSSVGVRGHSC